MDFPEFSWMLGAFGANHRESDEVAFMKIDDPLNPLNDVFGGNGFEFVDEFFRYPEMYTRENVRVLYSFDVDRTDLNQGRAYGECMREDDDYPVAWVKSYGAGRVYYTSIGHNPYVLWNNMFLQHFLAAIQFALGDLPAPTVASAKVDRAQLAAERLGWKLAVQFWSFNRFSFYESLEKAKSLGLSYAEVYSFSPSMGQPLSPEHRDVLFTHAIPMELRRETRHAADRAGLRLLNAYIGDFGSSEPEMRKVFEFARDMGITTLVGEPEPGQWDALEKLCDEYGINLAIHHHHRENSRYWDPEYLAGLLKGRSPRLGACPDTGHWLRAGVDPVDGLKKLEGRILNVHLKDLNAAGRIEAHDVPWGTGKSDVRAILAELKRQNYRGGIVIEYEHNWENSLPEIEKSIGYFKQTVLELAQ
jgi:sugar phosphate isomerase/epimerase